MYLSGTSACRSVIAAALCSLSSRVPSGASPPVRCSRANASTSPTVELIRPAGPADRGSPQAAGARSSSSPGSPMCPTAARCSSASSGSVPVCSRPSGVTSRSRIASSHVPPVTCSITRPASERPELQYDQVAPSGWFCAASLEPRDVLLEAVVAAPGVGEDVAVDAARVREQMPHRHLLRHLGIGEPKVGQHVDDRGVELDQPLVHELQHDRGRPHLRHRADLEHGVRVVSTPVTLFRTPYAASTTSSSAFRLEPAGCPTWLPEPCAGRPGPRAGSANAVCRSWVLQSVEGAGCSGTASSVRVVDLQPACRRPLLRHADKPRRAASPVLRPRRSNGGQESSLPAAMGHTSSSLALEVYARKMERNRDTGARMDALLRGADWAQAGTSEQVAVPFPGGENVLERQKAPR